MCRLVGKTHATDRDPLAHTDLYHHDGIMMIGGSLRVFMKPVTDSASHTEGLVSDQLRLLPSPREDGKYLVSKVSKVV